MQLRIYTPGQAAEALSISVPALVAILRRYCYPFTELAAGGRPGDRGRGRWGLSEDQLRAVLEGQARAWAPPAEAGRRPSRGAASPDGIDRLRYPKFTEKRR